MSYLRFALMILTSTVVMFVLMYLNTYAFEHVFYSETRIYMAILMGAAMAVIMLSFMLRMYDNRALNAAIFVGAIAVFAGALWLVRSQVTVSGESYMRAMIPHHSIAVMTSERARIRDGRVRKLADGIIEAQRREIAEMRYLIAAVARGATVDRTYQDPAAQVGSVADALGNTLISTLDPAPIKTAEADQILPPGPRCAFNNSPATDPILWVSQEGEGGAIKLNGVLVPLGPTEGSDEGFLTLTAPGAMIDVRMLAEEADWRQNAELAFALDQGLTIGYRGFWSCRVGAF